MSKLWSFVGDKIMFSSQLSFIFSTISILLGMIGIFTAHYVIGGPLAAIGFLFSAMSCENCEKALFPIIGGILCIIALGWFSFLCIGADRLSGSLGLF